MPPRARCRMIWYLPNRDPGPSLRTATPPLPPPPPDFSCASSTADRRRHAARRSSRSRSVGAVASRPERSELAGEPRQEVRPLLDEPLHAELDEQVAVALPDVAAHRDDGDARQQ